MIAYLTESTACLGREVAALMLIIVESDASHLHKLTKEDYSLSKHVTRYVDLHVTIYKTKTLQLQYTGN